MNEHDYLLNRVAALEEAVGRLSLQIEESPFALEFPEPIATPLAKEAGASLHHEKLFSLIDAGEACIKYTGAQVIALAIQGGETVDISKIFRQAPSLGTWIQITRQLVTSGKLGVSIIGEDLRNSLYRSNGKPRESARYLLDEFVNLRNQLRGHTSSLTDDAYRQHYIRHKDLLHDTLRSLEYLRYPLGRVESLRMDSASFNYDVKLLIGPSPLSQLRRIVSTCRLSPGATCNWDKEQGLLDLGNVITYRTCEICSTEHTFFLERQESKRLDYHSYSGNHRFQESL